MLTIQFKPLRFFEHCDRLIVVGREHRHQDSVPQIRVKKKGTIPFSPLPKQRDGLTVPLRCSRIESFPFEHISEKGGGPKCRNEGIDETNLSTMASTHLREDFEERLRDDVFADNRERTRG